MDKTNNNILEPSFKKFLKLLNDNQVEYIVIGGYAVAIHGYIRATGDIDIWINQNAENADKMLTVMLQFGFDAYDFRLEDFMLVDGKAGFVSIGQEPFKIEILGEISGVNFFDCFVNKIVVEIERLSKAACARSLGRLHYNFPEIGEESFLKYNSLTVSAFGG
jgi:predicted nucleotidyltransferase